MITIDTKFAEKLVAESGENIYLCYQCHRCISGCPLVEYFDLTPPQIMRTLQLGQEDLVLNSKTIWLCASCLTCTTRCPQGLDVVRVMDKLKMIALDRGITPRVPEVALFNRVFLRDVNLFGRMYELGLIAEMNLRTRRPFKDLPMGWEMLRKGKLKLFPSYTRYPKKVKLFEARPNRIAYYPGCSLHSSASEYNASIKALSRRLAVELIEPPGWICCGSSPAHATSDFVAALLPIKNLALVEKSGLRDVVTPCAGCFSRFKAATYALERDAELREQIAGEVDYQGQVEIYDIVDFLTEYVGLAKIESAVTNPLAGLKVAPYYGCVLTRPPKVTGVQDPEYPVNMDQLLEALGADTLDWSYRTECCGGNLGLTRTELALALSRKILENAHQVGAEVIAVACPLCQVNLDARQEQMHLDYHLPVVYITQLVGIALGALGEELGLQKLHVNPVPLLEKKGLIAGRTLPK